VSSHASRDIFGKLRESPQSAPFDPQIDFTIQSSIPIFVLVVERFDYAEKWQRGSRKGGRLLYRILGDTIEGGGSLCSRGGRCCRPQSEGSDHHIRKIVGDTHAIQGIQTHCAM